MSLKTFELDKKMLDYSISQFRNIPEYVKMCEAFTVGLNTIQDTINYLSDVLNIDKTEGIWLDYIGLLVGQARPEYISTSKYFCVNSEDVNVPKFFYFPNSTTNNSDSNLDDDLFKGQIKAKIAYNVSKGTREDLIKIIKPLVNADRVVIQRTSPMVLKISLYGENIIQTNIDERVLSVLPDGVGLYGNDVIVYDDSQNYLETIDGDFSFLVNSTPPDNQLGLNTTEITRPTYNELCLNNIASSGIKRAIFGSIRKITSGDAFFYTFENCINMEDVKFNLLSETEGNHTFNHAFQGCIKLKNVIFKSLKSVDFETFINAFEDCLQLQNLSFPSLESMSLDYSDRPFKNMLSGVTGCTVHFPSNLQSVIGSWSDVTAGFGGTNTTVLFDLPATT